MGISKHWLFGNTCDYPKLTDYEREVFTGILMSDGSIDRTHNYPRINIDMTTKEYLDWLYSDFQPLFTPPRQIMTAEESAQHAVNQGLVEEANGDNYSPVYRIRTRSMPAFEEFESWYNESGEKIWPKENITITTFKHLYVGDGNFDTHHSSGRIRITASNESENMDGVVKMFRESELPTPKTFRGRDIQFTVEQSKQLFNMMGEAPPGFGYKWPDKK
jgi:hypothetical protein